MSRKSKRYELRSNTIIPQTKLPLFIICFLWLYSTDIDECKEGAHNCPSGKICKNTDGGFQCLGKFFKF